MGPLPCASANFQKYGTFQRTLAQFQHVLVLTAASLVPTVNKTPGSSVSLSCFFIHVLRNKASVTYNSYCLL